jgi:hypothetical protein
MRGRADNIRAGSIVAAGPTRIKTSESLDVEARMMIEAMIASARR